MSKRRIIFSVILLLAIAFDMISTYFVIAAGGYEKTGLMIFLMNISYWSLIYWAIGISLLFYLLYPLFIRWKIRTQMEAVIIYHIMLSMAAGFGNFYLYLHM